MYLHCVAFLHCGVQVSKDRKAVCGHQAIGMMSSLHSHRRVRLLHCIERSDSRLVRVLLVEWVKNELSKPR